MIKLYITINQKISARELSNIRMLYSKSNLKLILIKKKINKFNFEKPNSHIIYTEINSDSDINIFNQYKKMMKVEFIKYDNEIFSSKFFYNTLIMLNKSVDQFPLLLLARVLNN